jgi:hypothetical protein
LPFVKQWRVPTLGDVYNFLHYHPSSNGHTPLTPLCPHPHTPRSPPIHTPHSHIIYTYTHSHYTHHTHTITALPAGLEVQDPSGEILRYLSFASNSVSCSWDVKGTKHRLLLSFLLSIFIPHFIPLLSDFFCYLAFLLFSHIVCYSISKSLFFVLLLCFFRCPSHLHDYFNLIAQLHFTMCQFRRLVFFRLRAYTGMR